METIQSPRLRIHLCDQDAAVTLGQLLSDPAVHEPYFVGRTSCQPDPLAWVAYFQQGALDQHERSKISLAARLRADDAVIGCIQVTGEHLSYFLNPAYWQQGYGQEMVSACCRELPKVLGLTRLSASVIRENLASRHILERTGFSFEGLETRPLSGLMGHVAMLRYTLLCTIALPSDVKTAT